VREESRRRHEAGVEECRRGPGLAYYHY